MIPEPILALALISFLTLMGYGANELVDKHQNERR